MTIPTKFLIGLFLLMFIGSFLAALYGCDGATVADIQNQWAKMADSYSTINVTGIAQAIYQTFGMLNTIAQGLGAMIWWNFCFFNQYEFIRWALVAINVALLVQILIDIGRALKPFGG